MSVVDKIRQEYDALPPEELKKRLAVLAKVRNEIRWAANDGPQTLAYRCPADVLLYGGQGGGGKTDLGLGLAFTAHQKTLILRRKYNSSRGRKR